MAKQVIALGTAPSGLDGDDARTAFQKTNANFTELYDGTVNQPTNAKLSAISASVWAANQLMYSTGANTLAMAPLTAAGRALLDDADAAAQRTTLGLGGTILQALQALAMTANGVPYMTSTTAMAVQASTAFGRGLWNLADAAALRSTAGLGTAALLTATTSTTDNTAGRALRVGDHGVGTSSSTMSSSTPLESLVSHSLFSTQDSLPPDWGAAPQELLAKTVLYPMGLNFYRSPSVRSQMAMSYSSTTIGDMRFRTTYGTGTWSDWKTLLGRGDLGVGINTNLETASTVWQGNKFTGWASSAPDSPFGTNSVGIDMGYADNRRMQIAVSTGNAFFYRYANTPDGQQNWSQVLSTYNASALPLTTPLAPNSDAARGLGGASSRWSVVYSATGAINTSDGREKTPVRRLTASEIAAAKELGKEIGAYKWLASIQEKGNGARDHIGMTVQRAIEIMEAHGLDPFEYGFVCYDQWEDKWEDIPAVESTVPADPVYGAEMAEDPVTGELVESEVQTNAGEVVIVVTEPASRRLITPAGNRFSFRFDELNMFIAAGFEARLAALEAAMG